VLHSSAIGSNSGVVTVVLLRLAIVRSAFVLYCILCDGKSVDHVCYSSWATAIPVEY
jgi:hypothetical protein